MIRYITYVPAHPPIDGKVIVHNHVHPENFHPRYEPGFRGFRVWLSDPGPDRRKDSYPSIRVSIGGEPIAFGRG